MSQCRCHDLEVLYPAASRLELLFSYPLSFFFLSFVVEVREIWAVMTVACVLFGCVNRRPVPVEL